MEIHSCKYLILLRKYISFLGKHLETLEIRVFPDTLKLSPEEKEIHT